MPTRDYAVTMARHNLWQNDSFLTAADSLTPQARAEDRGAFFGSIAHTFSHLLWADRIWMSRFGLGAAPEGGIAGSLEMYADWNAYRTERAAFDRVMLDWAKGLEDGWFAGEQSWYSAAKQVEVSKPRAMLVVHMFNHQTHHRGQIHAMLTAAGARTGDTDIPFIPPAFARL